MQARRSRPAAPGVPYCGSMPRILSSRILTSRGFKLAILQNAGDMRHQVRTRIAAGEDPEQVRAWMIERYGDYISYKPVVSSTTWPLFAIPLVLLVLVALILRRRLGRVT